MHYGSPALTEVQGGSSTGAPFMHTRGPGCSLETVSKPYRLVRKAGWSTHWYERRLSIALISESIVEHMEFKKAFYDGSSQLVIHFH